MLDFLSPAYLAAAAVAAIPLLLHLMRRRIGTRLEFPAVRYLARAEREHSRKLRLRNLLLMLMRVLAVLLIALAAARPVARLGGGGHAPTALAIVLDNSLSSSAISGGRSVLDELKTRARAVASRATGEDRLYLVTADAVVRGGSRNTILDAIDRVQPLAGAGELERALVRAGSTVRMGPPGARWTHEREIVVLTDAQATSWRQAVSLGDARVAAYRPTAPAPRNTAVTTAAARPPRWTPRGTVIARVLAPDSVTYRIALEGRNVARGTAARDEEIAVRLTPPERGWSAGLVEVEPDELRGDNTRHFAAWIGPAPGISVHPQLETFAQNAVEALRQTERVASGADVQVTPADGVTRLPALLFAPADPVRIGAANRTLERLGVPWRFGSPRRGETAARSTDALRTLDGVSVTLRYALAHARGGAPADTLAIAGGEAWVVGGPGYVLVSSPLSPDATTLPVRAAFVPWLNDVLTQRLADDGGTLVELPPGAPLARPPGIDGLDAPGGHRLPIGADTIPAPERPGVYFFLRGTRRVGAAVVNPEPDESILDRLDDQSLKARLRARESHVTADSTRWASEIFQSSPRRAAMLPVLLLALGVLIVESALAGPGRRRVA